MDASGIQPHAKELLGSNKKPQRIPKIDNLYICSGNETWVNFLSMFETITCSISKFLRRVTLISCHSYCAWSTSIRGGGSPLRGKRQKKIQQTDSLRLPTLSVSVSGWHRVESRTVLPNIPEGLLHDFPHSFLSNALNLSEFMLVKINAIIYEGN